MRYLITGGAGFIGSHIVERLLKEGHFVRALDNFSSGKKENLNFVPSLRGATPSKARGSDEAISTIVIARNEQTPVIARSEQTPVIARSPLTTSMATKQSQSFELIRGDIRDYNTCLNACAGIDYVLHQAALRSVPKSMEQPHEYNAVNIDGTVNMLRAASQCGVKRFVFASSSSVYGDTDQFPESEDLLPQPISPYALTKLAGEHYCHIFSEHYNLETVCLRYFNVFGPRQALDDEYAVVIPKFIHCLLNDEQPPIFGTGRQSRDFTYVDNVVEANILAATKDLRYTEYGIRNTETAVSYAVLNVANGRDNTVLQLAEALNSIIGKEIEPEFLPLRPGDIFRTCADISKIRRILGFQPKVDFHEGLEKTIEWFKQNVNKSTELEECAGLKRSNRI